MKKAVGYCRVSTESQVENGISLDAQYARIESWAEANGFQIIQIMEDAGISGKSTENREGLLEAVDLACRESAALVVYSLSRLSRSTKDTISLAEKLGKTGADLVSLSEDINTTSAAGKMIFRLLAVLNEFERDQISERIRMVLQHKKEQGLVCGQIPYSMRRDGDRLIPDKEQKRILRMIRRWRGNGWSLRKITEYLNSHKVPAKKGGKWYASSVRSILRN
ncbi:MAG: recombinase family protein [Candidatus Thorarchaeota archaeon]